MLFWEKGYSDTSLVDLEQATGLNRRQLYNGIGDKQEMFVSAMDAFVQLSVQLLLAPLESENAGVEDIKELFAKFVEMSKMPAPENGCLICSTSQDEIAKEPAVSKRIEAFFERIRNAHLNALTRAAERGEISLNAKERERRADTLYGAHVALCVLGRARRPEGQLKQIAAHAVEGIS